jgi:protein phosphatase
LAGYVSGARLELPARTVVLTVGASGSGKTTWALGHFRETEVVSTDRCRALVADREESQRASRHAFAVFYEILCQRVLLGRLSIADSTGLSPRVRRRVRDIAAAGEAPVVAVVFETELEVALQRNAARSRRVPEEVVERQVARLSTLLDERTLENEGYAAVHRVEPGARLPIPVRKTR